MKHGTASLQTSGFALIASALDEQIEVSPAWQFQSDGSKRRVHTEKSSPCVASICVTPLKSVRMIGASLTLLQFRRRMEIESSVQRIERDEQLMTELNREIVLAYRWHDQA